MEKCKKSKVEIELELHRVYSYEFHTAGNKGISIGFLRTTFFYMQNNKKYIVTSKIHSKSINTMQ